MLEHWKTVAKKVTFQMLNGCAWLSFKSVTISQSSYLVFHDFTTAVLIKFVS